MFEKQLLRNVKVFTDDLILSSEFCFWWKVLPVTQRREMLTVVRTVKNCCLGGFNSAFPVYYNNRILHFHPPKQRCLCFGGGRGGDERG